MATDLSRAPERVQTQRRVTNNRAGVIPERRNDRMPEFTPRADMRNGFRANNADEVRRALGMATNAVEAVTNLRNEQATIQAEADASQAVADHAMGTVDEAKVQRSTAYRVAISMGRARSRLADLEVALLPEVQDMLDRAEYADPTKGEEVIDLEDVNALIEERFRGVLLSPEGEPVDFGDPAANDALYTGLGRLRERVTAQAAQIIKQQEEKKAASSISLRFMLDVKEGKTDTLEDYMREGAILGLDMGTLKGELLSSALAAAGEAKQTEIDLDGDGDNDDFIGPAALDRLANSVRGDGTPSWNPQERLQLQREASRLREQIERDIEKEKAEKSAETLASLTLDIFDGKGVDTNHIRRLVAEGQLLPQDADNVLAAQDRAISRRREDIRWGWAVSDRNYELQQRAIAARERAARAARGGQSGSVAGQLRVGILSGALSGPQGQREALRLYNAGQINDGQLEDILKTARQAPNATDIVRDRGASNQAAYMSDFVSALEARAGQPGHIDRRTARQRTTAAQETFYRGLRMGLPNDRALYEGLRAGGVREDVARRGALTASGNLRNNDD